MPDRGQLVRLFVFTYWNRLAETLASQERLIGYVVGRL